MTRLARILCAFAVLSGPCAASAQMQSAAALADAPAVPVITVWDDWQVVCRTDQCHAETRVAGSPFIQMTIVMDQATPVLIARAPLGLLLAEGIRVTIDGRDVGQLAFLTCEADGCVAPVRLDSTLNRAMRAGREMTLTISRRDESSFAGAYSLIGFIAALSALEDSAAGTTPTP